MWPALRYQGHVILKFNAMLLAISFFGALKWIFGILAVLVFFIFLGMLIAQQLQYAKTKHLVLLLVVMISCIVATWVFSQFHYDECTLKTETELTEQYRQEGLRDTLLLTFTRSAMIKDQCAIALTGAPAESQEAYFGYLDFVPALERMATERSLPAIYAHFRNNAGETFIIGREKPKGSDSYGTFKEISISSIGLGETCQDTFWFVEISLHK